MAGSSFKDINGNRLTDQQAIQLAKLRAKGKNKAALAKRAELNDKALTTSAARTGADVGKALSGTVSENGAKTATTFFTGLSVLGSHIKASKEERAVKEDSGFCTSLEAQKNLCKYIDIKS